MSVGYKPVIWTSQKKKYDRIMLLLIVAYFVCFVVFHLIFHPQVIPQTLLIRGTAMLAVLMLHIILAIGPLARLDDRFLPLLYNRRHLGVTMFLISLIHGVISIVWFHGVGNENPILSIFTSNMRYDSFVDFPFQTLGFFALIIFFLMAATSHDFWLKNLSPKIWKSLHMLVYIAYGLVIMHVMLGAVQVETSPVLSGMLGVGLFGIVGLHLTAAFKETQQDQEAIIETGNWVKVAHIDEMENNRAKTVCANGEKIAIFKYDGKLSAVSNVCKHQNGPLGEGKVVDGCITCPWHGYQYLPHNGQSPAPFTEKVPTYEVKLVDKMVFVNAVAKPEGTEIKPITY